jgi:hypothetical protein
LLLAGGIFSDGTTTVVSRSKGKNFFPNVSPVIWPGPLRYSFSFQRAVQVFSFGDCPISTEAEKNKEGRAGVCS